MSLYKLKRVADIHLDLDTAAEALQLLASAKGVQVEPEVPVRGRLDGRGDFRTHLLVPAVLCEFAAPKVCQARAAPAEQDRRPEEEAQKALILFLLFRRFFYLEQTSAIKLYCWANYDK